MQRGHPFGIVDEVDNILIDEARTPLIISGAPEEAGDLYRQLARLAPTLEGRPQDRRHQGRSSDGDGAEPDYDYEYDEKHKTVAPTERGVAKAEKFLGIENMYLVRARQPRQPPDPGAEGRVALQARQGLRGDRRRGEDHRRVHRPHPRRAGAGRRGCTRRSRPRRASYVREENQTLATVTLQNYFRMYDKLAGMTGTALTEANEFIKIYKLAVVDIPTNQPMVRADHNDQIYKTKDGKWSAVAGRDQGAPRGGAAGAGRDDLGRGLGDALRRPEEERRQARGAEREARARPARGRDDRRGGPPRRGHDRDQHGGPRRRHHARRQRRAPHARWSCASSASSPATSPRTRPTSRSIPKVKARGRRRRTRR